MADDPQPLSRTNLYSNNSTNSHNISNSHNSTHSTVVNYGTILLTPQADEHAAAVMDMLNQMYLNQDDSVEGDLGFEGSSSPIPSFGPQHRPKQQDSVSPDQSQHFRGESMAMYTPLQTRFEASAMKSAKGMTCRLQNMNNARVKLPKRMANYIEQYLRSKFIEDFVDWISMWVPSQGCKPGPVPIPHRNIGPGDVGFFDEAGEFEILFNVFLSEKSNIEHGYHPPPNFVSYSEEPYEGQLRHRYLRNVYEKLMLIGDIEHCKKLPENGKSVPILSLKTPLTTDSMKGTALFLPDGMVRTALKIHDLDVLKGYFDMHAAGWYEFYKNRPIRRKRIESGSLLFVRVCYKTKTWAMASFVKSKSSHPQEVRLDLYKPDPSSDIYTWELEGEKVRAKTGPPLEETENGGARDYSQCVAIEVSSLEIKKELIKGFTASVQSFMSRTSLFSRASTINASFV
ncbi:hypothetical protein CPB84DRAFT_1846146 [Gymnopilus junonius]|uniref:Uncharacterized protein n=1 Tax=Gymnopilus junonius TaxID=109634 RepID=A0A9P5NT09_GYMJU|nr:hypothetical protein CPB84DRAFT_1846146 [Gymnopilus junonius]